MYHHKWAFFLWKNIPFYSLRATFKDKLIKSGSYGPLKSTKTNGTTVRTQNQIGNESRKDESQTWEHMQAFDGYAQIQNICCVVGCSVYSDQFPPSNYIFCRIICFVGDHQNCQKSEKFGISSWFLFATQPCK